MSDPGHSQLGLNETQPLLTDERGLTSLEYATLFLVVVVASIAVWRGLGEHIACTVETNRQKLFATLEGKEHELSTRCSALADSPEPSSANPQGGVVWDNPTSAASAEPMARQTTAPAPAPRPAEVWKREVLQIMCPGDKAFLRQLLASGVTITAYDRIYFDDPYFDGKRWSTKRFEAGGTTRGKHIDLIRSGDSVDDAATIYHEGVHTQQGSAPWREQEYEAYAKEDAWRLARGLPPAHPRFRKKDSAGQEVTDLSAVRAFVDKRYPGVTSQASGGAPEEIIDKDSSGNTVLRRADGSIYTRPPRKGDSFSADEPVVSPAGGIPIDIQSFQCP